MPWRGPEYEGEFPSLGWVVVDWIHSLGLIVPAGRLAGEPLVLADSQVKFFVHWYRLKEDGRRRYRRGQNRGPKGASKSPEGGLACLAEYDGPSMFAGWDANGEPVGKVREDAVVQIVGLSEGQAGNMYDWLYTMLSDSPAADENGWNVELGRITKQKGGYGVLEASTSSVSSTGRPQTFVAKEETWLWTRSSGMHRVSKAINANVTKTGGTTCEFTNPPELGRETVAELTGREAGKENPRRPILIYSREATLPKEIAKTGIKLRKNEALVREAIRSAYGDTLVSEGGWFDEEDALEGIDEADEDEGYRLWLGVARDAVGKLAKDKDITRAERFGKKIPDGAPIAVTFDGSINEDSTVIMGTSIEPIPHQVILGMWEKPLGPDGDNWAVDTVAVDARMIEILSTMNVAILVADKGAGYESLITTWQARWGETTKAKIGEFKSGLVYPMNWNMWNRDVDTMTRLWKSGIESDPVGFTFDGDPRVRRHLDSMLSGGTGKFLRPVKEETQAQGIKIDAGITSIMGYWAAREMLKQSRGVIKQGAKSAADAEKAKREAMRKLFDGS